MHQIIKIVDQNSYTFTWGGLEDSAGDYVNNATMTMTLRDSNGDAVAGMENVTVAYVSGSNGRYEGTIPSTIDVMVGSEYTLEVTAYYGVSDGFRTFEVEILDPTVTDQIVTLYKQNDNAVIWDGMEDADGEYVDDAAVTMTLRDPDGNTVSQVVNSAVSYVAGSHGRYQGAISSNVGLIVQSGYTLEVSASLGSDRRFLKFQTIVLDRTT